jgi:hypothetical protein
VIFESLKDHVVGSFDLAIAPRVGDRRIVNVDSVILAEVPEDRASESFAQVGYDPVGHTEAVYDISSALCGFFRCYFRNRSDFNPLGEFVCNIPDVYCDHLALVIKIK